MLFSKNHSKDSKNNVKLKQISHPSNNAYYYSSVMRQTVKTWPRAGVLFLDAPIGPSNSSYAELHQNPLG